MARKLTGYRFYFDLLKGIKRQVREAQGPEDDELNRYYRGYAAVLERAHPESSTEEAFLDRAAESGLALVGDFHTLDQAQNQFLKLVRDLHASGRPPVLALEMVQAHHDRTLAAFVEGERPDECEFLEKIGFFEHWGFDFAHYRPILSTARRLGLPVHGINTDGTLRQRDRFMAQRIADLKERYADHPVLVLVGDLHLGPRHIPALLARLGLTPVLLFQNSESVTMRRLRKGQEPFGWFRLDEDRFLVNNTPPWIKMQTHLTWIEHGGEALTSLQNICGGSASGCGGESGEGDEQEGPPDLTGTVHTYIRILKDLFGLKLRADDNFQVYTMRDLDFLAGPAFRREPGKTQAAIIREGRALFLKQGNILYIPMLDVNRTVQEAAHYLMQADLDTGEGPAPFFRRLHYFASGFLASKMINPLRHYHTRESMRRAKEDLSRLRTEKERAYARRQIAVFKNTLDFFDEVERRGSVSRLTRMELERYLKADRETLFSLSEQIGFQLGEGLYETYDTGRLSGEELKHYIFSQADPFHYARVFARGLGEALDA